MTTDRNEHRIAANRRLLESTRGRLLGHLLRGPLTAGELAERLDISGNAVRQHLAGLEGDGLVERAGKRGTGGKPAVLYRIGGAGEALFPKGYADVLRALADVLAQQGADADDLLARTGRRLAEEARGAWGAGGTPGADEGLDAALEALAALGARADVERRADGSVVVTGHACPLSDVVPEHPELCGVLVAMVAAMTGRAVGETCETDGPRPRCRFLIDAPAA